MHYSGGAAAAAAEMAQVIASFYVVGAAQARAFVRNLHTCSFRDAALNLYLTAHAARRVGSVLCASLAARTVFMWGVCVNPLCV